MTQHFLFGRRPAPPPSGGPVAIVFANSYPDTTDQTTYTFSSAAIGTASADRIVIVVIGSRANSARSISSVTIAGIAATVIATANNTGGGADIVAIYAAAVPSGTTGNVVITFSGTMLRCGIGTYAMTGASSVTPYDTATAVPSGSSASINTIDSPANGAILGASLAGSSGTASVTWTGLTENFDIQPETSSSGVSGACGDFASSQTNRTVGVTVGSVLGPQALAVASWGP